MCIAFLPFPTNLVADHLRHDGVRAATITYRLTMTAASIYFASLWYAAIGRRLIAETTDQNVTGLSRRMIPGLLIYAAGTLVALCRTPHSCCSREPRSFAVGSSLFQCD